MKSANVFVHRSWAGVFIEHEGVQGRKTYTILYREDYRGPPISLTMPVIREPYCFDTFPCFFDGLLPEGDQLAGLLRHRKIDKNDYFAQLLAVGEDLVGAVTVRPAK